MINDSADTSIGFFQGIYLMRFYADKEEIKTIYPH